MQHVLGFETGPKRDEASASLDSLSSNCGFGRILATEVARGKDADF